MQPKLGLIGLAAGLFLAIMASPRGQAEALETGPGAPAAAPTVGVPPAAAAPMSDQDPAAADPAGEATPEQEYRSEFEDVRQLFGIQDPAAQTGRPRPPQIEHQPVSLGQEGQPVEIVARVSDDKTAVVAYLYYRSLGTGQGFRGLTMARDADHPQTYRAVIPGTAIGSRGVEYYIEARDEDGNSTLSTADATTPHRLSVEQSSQIGWWLLFTAAVLLIPAFFILLQRRIQKVRRDYRTGQVRRFVERQQELEKMRRKLYQRHLRAMRGRSGEDEEMEVGSLADSEKAGAPPPRRTRERQRAAPPARERSLDDLISDIEQKLDEVSVAGDGDFDLEAEARSLLSNLGDNGDQTGADLLGAASPDDLSDEETSTPDDPRA